MHRSEMASLESVLPRSEQASALRAAPKRSARQRTFSFQSVLHAERLFSCARPPRRDLPWPSWYRLHDQRVRPVRPVLYFHVASPRVVFYSRQTFLCRVSPERKALRCAADRGGWGETLFFSRFLAPPPGQAAAAVPVTPKQREERRKRKTSFLAFAPAKGEIDGRKVRGTPTRHLRRLQKCSLLLSARAGPVRDHVSSPLRVLSSTRK